MSKTLEYSPSDTNYLLFFSLPFAMSFAAGVHKMQGPAQRSEGKSCAIWTHNLSHNPLNLPSFDASKTATTPRSRQQAKHLLSCLAVVFWRANLNLIDGVPAIPCAPCTPTNAMADHERALVCTIASFAFPVSAFAHTSSCGPLCTPSSLGVQPVIRISSQVQSSRWL